MSRIIRKKKILKREEVGGDTFGLVSDLQGFVSIQNIMDSRECHVFIFKYFFSVIYLVDFSLTKVLRDYVFELV